MTSRMMTVINARPKDMKNCVTVYPNAKFKLSATFGFEVRWGGANLAP